METTERINTIAADASTAVIDRIETLHSHAWHLTEEWLKTVSESQKANLDLTKSLVKHSFNAQSALSQYAREATNDLGNPFTAATTAAAPKNGQKPASK